MSLILINKKSFREFQNELEASEWALKYYERWIREIQIDKGNLDPNSIAYLLYVYSGNMNVVYNNFLRGVSEYTKSEIEEYTKGIDTIKKEISKFELQENIVVYRYTHTKLFRFLFENFKTKKGKQFTDKGFMSTTLVPELLKSFAKNHRYNCVLKLYLPKGTKGVYIKFDESILNEQEFLLPPNSTFTLLKRRFSFKYGMVYECILEHQ